MVARKGARVGDVGGGRTARRLAHLWAGGWKETPAVFVGSPVTESCGDCLQSYGVQAELLTGCPFEEVYFCRDAASKESDVVRGRTDRRREMFE